MTVAIGLVCDDGVLVASDSMASNQMIAENATKVHALKNNPVIWTASGSVYVIEEVDAVLRKLDVPQTGPAAPAMKLFATPELDAIRARLSLDVRASMRASYQAVLTSTPPPPGAVADTFATSFLLLGYSNSVGWFLEIAQDGQVNWHKSFYAVGSGGQFASVCHGLMQHYIVPGLTLDKGKKLAFRAIHTTCSVSSAFVGLPVQMAIADATGQRVLEPDEISEIEVAVERWKTLEVDALDMSAKDATREAEGDLPSIEDSVTPA